MKEAETMGKVLEMISAQQPKEENDVWMVGEQLKDIARESEEIAEILEKDLAVPEMGLAKAAAEIRKAADKKRGGMRGASCVVITPKEADAVLRRFYGIPEKEAAPAPEKTGGHKVIDLLDLI